MAKKDLSATIEVPEGITVSKEETLLLIKGPKGTVTRVFNYPSVKVEVENNIITMSSSAGSKRDKAVINAYQAHLKNALAGVKEPFVYKLKICSGHFPMNVSVANKVLAIKNFLGEKVPRQVKIKEGVNVKVEGNTLTVEGPDKELTGQVAADIEQATRRPGFDRRIFQDGIYITEKAGKTI
jgi:large subunit ribosomal protein L6